MTLIEGLTAANLALGLVKDLREIDRSVDEAGFKLKLAELTSALADAKIALSDANLELNESKIKAATLERELETAVNGDICPQCKKGRMKLEKTRPKTQHGLNHYGVEEWHFTCDDRDCNFQQKKLHDPHGVLQKAATKKF